MSKESHVLAIDKIKVDFGDHLEEFTNGQDLSSVPAGALKSMVRLGQAVTKKEWEKAQVQEPEEEAADPASTLVDELGLPAQVTKALQDAELKTIGDVLAYGAKHGGTLVSINGIGESSEKEIQKAIASLMEQ